LGQAGRPGRVVLGEGRPTYRRTLAPISGPAWRIVAALAVAAIWVAGCGSSQPTFTASEFIDRINAEGVSIELGRRLPSGENADQLYAVELPPLPGEPPPPPRSAGGPGASGTLYVFGDAAGADDQLEGCRGSGGLLCFRASNIVVVLGDEGGGLEAQRLAVAMKRLATR
jgi:hypothetical protein